MKRIITLLTAGLLLAASLSHAEDFVDTSRVYGWSGTYQFSQYWPEFKAQLSEELSLVGLSGMSINLSDLDDLTITGATVNAGSFVVGIKYNITSVGTTDFTLIGAATNEVGVSFTASGVGSGTGITSEMLATVSDTPRDKDKQAYSATASDLLGGGGGGASIEYAGLSFFDETTPATVAVPVIGTWYKASIFDSVMPLSDNMTANSATDTILIPEDGDYLLSFDYGLNGGEDEIIWAGFGKNGIATPLSTIAPTPTTRARTPDEIQAASVSGIASLVVDDTVNILVMNGNGITDIPFFSGNFSALRIGDTSPISTTFEDLLTYLEEDPASHISVTSTRASFDLLPKNATAYVVKDMGVDGVSGDFEFQFEANITDFTTAGNVHTWAVSNTLGHGQEMADGFYLRFWVSASSYRLSLSNVDGSSSDAWTDGPVAGTTYFITVGRVADVITAVVRTGSHAGTVQDTLTRTAVPTTSYQYFYALQAINTFSATTITGWCQNYEIK